MARLRAADAARRRADDLGPEFSEALARGIAVVTAFDAERRQMTLSEVARAVDLPRATARRALHTLAHLGYVEQEGRLFRLTPRVLGLAAAYLGSNPVSTVLQPLCERITRAVGESCTTAVLDGEDAVMIARAAPARFNAIEAAAVGYRVPAFCSALGRVLLAGLADPALDGFLARLRPAAKTARTMLDKAVLRVAILRVRQQGFALVDQEAEAGFRSIAVPIRRLDGKVIAALNIGAPAERVALKVMRERYLPVLQQAAAELAAELL